MILGFALNVGGPTDCIFHGTNFDEALDFWIFGYFQVFKKNIFGCATCESRKTDPNKTPNDHLKPINFQKSLIRETPSNSFNTVNTSFFSTRNGMISPEPWRISPCLR